MKFTEHELTLATDAAARFLFTARQMPWRRGTVEARWKQMRPVQKYPFRSMAGETVIAALTALPERPVPGSVPTFDASELVDAAAAGAKASFESRSAKPWDTLTPKRRVRLTQFAVLITRAALAGLPPRIDPDATPDVPDFVPDDLL